MNTRRELVLIERCLVVLVPAYLGWLLYSAAAWLIHHESIYYALGGSGFEFLTSSTEIIFAIGPFLSPVAGMMLGLPFSLGYARCAQSLRRVAAVNALAGLTLLCALGSFSSLLVVMAFLLLTALLWVLALVLASIYPNQTAQIDSPADEGQTFH